MLRTSHIRRDGKPLSWISTTSVFVAFSSFMSLLIHIVGWASMLLKCQRQWLFSHQDQASLLSAAEDLDLLPLILCLCGFQGCVKRGGWDAGLELELHNGCLSELIKQKMFHPLTVSKRGHKGRRTPSRLWDTGTEMMYDESYGDMWSLLFAKTCTDKSNEIQHVNQCWKTLCWHVSGFSLCFHSYC